MDAAGFQPDCTEQACVMREARADLTDLETAVVGISPDPPEVLAAFDDDHDLGYPLLTDAGARTTEAWGATRRGRVLRSAVLVGRDGLVLGMRGQGGGSPWRLLSFGYRRRTVTTRNWRS
jgi:peroxiredoxin